MWYNVEKRRINFERRIKLNKRIKSRSGFTLVEMTVVILLISIFGLLCGTAITVASNNCKVSVETSHYIAVKDILNSELMGLVTDANPLESGKNAAFECEKYTGWTVSLGLEDGAVQVYIYTDGGVEKEPLMSKASYAEFTVTAFEYSFNGNCFEFKYTMKNDRFEQTEEFYCIPLFAQ